MLDLNNICQEDEDVWGNGAMGRFNTLVTITLLGDTKPLPISIISGPKNVGHFQSTSAHDPF